MPSDIYLSEFCLMGCSICIILPLGKKMTIIDIDCLVYNHCLIDNIRCIHYGYLPFFSDSRFCIPFTCIFKLSTPILITVYDYMLMLSRAFIRFKFWFGHDYILAKTITKISPFFFVDNTLLFWTHFGRLCCVYFLA